ncbi:heptaprenyl diphosphate synthase component 1 [Lentibacillus amyloliquefaciens]|uniref:Heptaprenyl diphosphate synthase n=1 Tax=Lentibacillus amyloliquefaciens TaxID=1472767 RepID=A0A0U3NMF5_9BACI|nr:heptaprenyl diphosphate synthase component 1 [Lentibacillus amyloliquefaciens]ALX47963.1 hypothetical protein AOX59_04675 [Lentibacillus amyloliquefaciens]
MDERVQVVVLQTSSMEISRLKALIQRKMHHTYIEQFVQIPQLDEDKLYILTSILNNTALSEEKKESYIVTAMLIQTALDTHDLVPDSNALQSNYEEKSKQLSVLAGDYYSGLYYRLLSEVDEVETTQVLATAITDINEYKMQLYYINFNSMDAFISIYKKMNSLLITRMATFTGETFIGNIAANWLMIRKLTSAKNHPAQSGIEKAFGPWFDKIPLNDYHSILNTFDSFIRQESTLIEKHLTKFPANLSATASYLKETLDTTSSINSSIAEEG